MRFCFVFFGLISTKKLVDFRFLPPVFVIRFTRSAAFPDSVNLARMRSLKCFIFSPFSALLLLRRVVLALRSFRGFLGSFCALCGSLLRMLPAVVFSFSDALSVGNNYPLPLCFLSSALRMLWPCPASIKTD